MLRKLIYPKNFRDIEWFNVFLPKFVTATKIFKPDITDINSLHNDACLTGVWDME